VLQLYTAAFDGRPAGALLAHRAILAQDLMVALVQQITEETVYLNSGPMFHMATLMTTFATLRMGGTNVLTRRVDAEELCRVIEAEHCNYGFVMGPTAQEILEVNKDGRYDLSSLRTFGGGERWNAMIQVDHSPWGTHPAGYGQTEVTGMLTFNALGIGTTGTSGRPSPLAQVRIVDPDGADVPQGETGEIVARGPIVTGGYHDRPALDDERFRGGWWHTGDLGRREPDGSITFVAPLTRIVKSAAENVYPVEVEGCLQGHPAVREVAVIGVPDRVWTQRVVAVVVLADGAQASEKELIDHCRAHIASYKKPSRVEFVDELPRKGWMVDYDALDEQFGGGGYPGSGRTS
ncbi:MAG TPA: AMP-binding protein, partial [Acidimicrobiales bacterium]|nr:AMP-binding protein [Acidimicrobiales bacterium]